MPTEPGSLRYDALKRRIRQYCPKSLFLRKPIESITRGLAVSRLFEVGKGLIAGDLTGFRKSIKAIHEPDFDRVKAHLDP